MTPRDRAEDVAAGCSDLFHDKERWWTCEHCLEQGIRAGVMEERSLIIERLQMLVRQRAGGTDATLADALVKWISAREIGTA